MRLLLVGNPNVGKSTLFNRITGSHVIVSNYPGTTVELAHGTLRTANARIEVVDLPGTYSINPSSEAEEVTSSVLSHESPGDVLVNVLDSTRLERGLNLTLQLTALRKPMIVALNFWDEAQHTGVHIDVATLEKILGVPCIPIVAVSGERTKTLVESFDKAAISPVQYKAAISPVQYDEENKWRKIGAMIQAVQQLTPRRHTFAEAFGDASLRPFPGGLIAFTTLGGAIPAIWLIAEALIRCVFDPFFISLWMPWMSRFSTFLGDGWLHALLIGELTNGQINYGEAFGLLTTGLYVPFAAVMPYVFSFYLVLTILEDSGYLPRLAILLDRVMHRVGLHGMGIVPMLLGFGCNVPGVLSSRMMESKRERFICITLTALAIPCMAQTAMILGLAGKQGLGAIVLIFGSLFIVWFVLGLILNRALGGESPEILMDVPPYRMPRVSIILKKVWMRLFWFLREAVPFVLGGVLIANLLYTFGIIDFMGRAAGPVIAGLMGLPEEAVGGMLIGFLRKDLAVGMLIPLDLTFRQTVVACVVLTLYFPCVATFAVMLRELGLTRLLMAVGIMVSTAITVGALLNLALWFAVR